MGGNVESYYDALAEKEAKEKKELKKKRIADGGCKNSPDGVHCGHHSHSEQYYRGDTMYGWLYCCYCNSRAGTETTSRKKTSPKHGKFYQEEELVEEILSKHWRKSK